MSDCIEEGYIIEPESTENSYVAYSEEGYKLSLFYYEREKEISLTLRAPMVMEELQWPVNIIANLLPTPTSQIGHIYWEDSTGFVVYIGDTSLEIFDQYVDACIDAGFDIDYNRGNTYYYAYNKEGYALYLNYAGNSIMCVHVEVPDDESMLEEESIPEDQDSSKESLSGESLVEWFVSEYNNVAPTSITDTVEIDVTDRASGHYRTEFRLAAFEGAYTQTGKIGDIEIDIVTYGWGENKSIRLYTNEITLEQAKEIIEFASPILDSSLESSDIQEVLDYLDEYKSANGYYYGNIGIVFSGDLMIDVG